jgi:hypothetical protein
MLMRSLEGIARTDFIFLSSIFPVAVAFLFSVKRGFMGLEGCVISLTRLFFLALVTLAVGIVYDPLACLLGIRLHAYGFSLDWV